MNYENSQSELSEQDFYRLLNTNAKAIRAVPIKIASQSGLCMRFTFHALALVRRLKPLSSTAMAACSVFFTDDTSSGTHRGIIGYTIGQRKGLGLALPESLYVREKDVASNEIRLSKEAALFSDRLVAEDVNWVSIAPPRPGEQIRVSAKPRYRAKETPATATVLDNGNVEVVFDEPVRAITRGQAVVLYDGELVVAGGTIV